MSETIISGLRTCKPKNAPVVGQIQAFVIENRGDWNKIKNPDKKNGEVGVNYRITKAEKTDYSDAHGNVSFNVELERVFGNAHPQPLPPPESQDEEYRQEIERVFGNRQNAPPTSQEARGDVLDPILETRQHVMKAANLQVICIAAVNSYVAEHCPEVAQTSEQFQGLVAQLFIEASGRRTTDGVNWWSYVDKMPTHPLKKEKPQPKAQPQNEQDDDSPPF